MCYYNLNIMWTISYKGSYIHGTTGRVGENIRVHQKYFKSVAAAKRWITMRLKKKQII